MSTQTKEDFVDDSAIVEAKETAETTYSSPPPGPLLGFARWKNNIRSFGQHKRVSLCCVAVLTLLVNFGFDSLISGQALAFTQFRMDYGRYDAGSDSYVVDALWQSLWAAANTMGVVVGSFISGYTNDRFGRKLSFWMHLVASIASSFLLLFAPNVKVLFAAKLMFGIAIGLAYTTVPLYVIENAPTEIRSILMSLFNTFIVFGQFLAVVVANPLSHVPNSWSYKGTFCLTFLIPAILLCIMPFLPESPAWLVMRGRNDDAEKAVVRLFGFKSGQHALVDEKLSDMKAALAASQQAEEEQKAAGYSEIFKSGNLKRTILVTAIYSIHHCSGMPFVLQYQAYFFQLSGVGDPFAINLGSFALMLFGNLGALVLPDFIGQRRTMVYGAMLLVVWNLIIAGAGFAGTDNKAAVMASVAFMASWAYFYQLTIGTIGFVVAPEIPSQRLRAKTQSFGTIVANIIGWGIAFAIPYLFNPDQANLGARLLIIFVGLLTPLTIYLWFFLPETRNRSLQQVEESYQQRK